MSHSARHLEQVSGTGEGISDFSHPSNLVDRNKKTLVNVSLATMLPLKGRAAKERRQR